MKPILYILLTAVSLYACTDNADMPNALGNPLTLRVQTNDFVPSSETRTPVEDGYKTVFKGGEQIGITAIKDGAIYNGMDNVPFTFDVATGAWTSAAIAVPYLYYYPGVTYIAYYPYDAGMSGKANEQAIIDAFTPQSDQSTYASYTASDLMTATGSVTGSDGAYIITFDLQHRMSMLVASVRTKYFMTSITDGYDYSSIVDYPTRNINKGKFAVGGVEYIACTMGDGTFRSIFKPATATQSVEFNFQLTTGQPYYNYSDPTQRKIEQGKYHLYSIVTTKDTPAVRQVCPGDFYYNSGDILPYDAVEAGVEIPLKDECIGIVFHAGAGYLDELSHYTGSGLETANAIHGYVVALQDAGSGVWGSRSYVDPIPQIERDADGGEERKSYRGFKNTKTLLDTKQTRFAIFIRANEYNATVPAPANSSGWYLPAIQQMQDIYSLYKNSAGNVIYDSMQKAGGTLFSGAYWTASQAYQYCSFDITMTNGSVASSSGKNNSKNSRAILTF